MMKTCTTFGDVNLMDELVEAQLQAALNLIPAFMWYAGPSGALRFVNRRGADYLGLAENDPLRRGLDTGAPWDVHIPFLHPDDQAETRKVGSTNLRTGSAGEVSCRVRDAQGHYRWFLSRTEPFRSSDGTVRFWIGINLDIEERKQAEFYLAEGQRLAHTGSWAFSAEGFSYWSPELFAIYGLEAGRTAPTIAEYLDLVHPEDRNFVAHEIQTMLAEHQSFDFTKRIVRPDGSIRSVRCVGVPAFQGETFGGFVGTGMDVTEQERLTQELQRREAYLAEAQRLSHTGSFGWKPDTGEFVWSDETYRIFEYDRAEKPTLNLLFERIHPLDRALVQQIIECASTGGTDFEHEYRLLMPSGAIKHLHVRAHALRAATGNIEFVGAVTDITARKAAEEKIREQEIEFRQMLDLAPQIIGVLGARRERLYANRVALGYYGVTLDEWRQRNYESEVHPDDIEGVTAHIDRSLTSGAPYELEMRLRAGDGTYRWFLVRYNPLRDDEGQLVRWYIACTDIEERKTAEERLQQENVALREEIDKTSMFEEIVGTSPALAFVLSRVAKVAGSDSTVLITGETGTGKELVARAIHRRSGRASRAFVAVNCAAIPRDLIASELFGHEKGAFTGALERRLGRFELANGGTIFLDEVGELAPETQVALLRVLQEREFERVGGRQPIRVDVRVIAATNRDLAEAVAAGAFRQDLFYRLNVFPLEVPPLRARKDDIAVLVEYFIDRYARKAGKTFRRISKRTLDRLKSYPWPGNVRELQNVIERSVIVSDTDEFTVDESWLFAGPAADSRLGFSNMLDSHEKALVEDALRATEGRVFGPAGAAARLGIPRSTLESRIRVLKIDKSRFRRRGSQRS